MEYLRISVERTLPQHGFTNSSLPKPTAVVVSRAAHSEAAEIPLLHLYSLALKEICALCEEACSLLCR